MIRLVQSAPETVTPHLITQKFAVVTWGQHLQMPRQTTEFYPGVFSCVFGPDDGSDGVINRIVYLADGCPGIGHQVHPDFRERFTVMKGRMREELSGEVVEQGQTIIIPPGVKHSFKRDSPGEIILDLILEHTPAGGSPNGQVMTFES